MRSKPLSPSSRKSRLAAEFLQGNYAEVLRSAESRELWLRVGALCFTGSQEEALSIFRQNEDRLDLDSRVACRFYLGVGFTRRSDYRGALRQFALNLREGRKAESAWARFYAFQGLAFFRFFSGRYSRAVSYAEKAYSQALTLEFDHGRILALDLLGHCHVQLGQIRQGIQELKKGLALATQAGNGGIRAAFEVTLLKYQAQFGLQPLQAISKIENALPSLKIQDTYSRAELELELVRQLILRGRSSEARDLLNRTCEQVYSNGNRRQAATLNLRYAHLMHLAGENFQATNLLRTAERNLVPEVDQTYLSQMQGLRRKILLEQGKIEEAQTLELKLHQRARLQGSLINRRILNRSNPEAPRPNQGEDPLGDLLDQVNRKEPQGLSSLVSSGYLGLIYHYLKSGHRERTLVFDLAPATLTVLDQGDVHLIQKGVSGVIRKLLYRLADGPASKEELITEIWGLRYHPLRHDPLVHTAIRKIRKNLGQFAHWIEWSETGYRLAPGIQVCSVLPRPAPLSSKEPEENLPVASPVTPLSKWNYRQIQIIELLRTMRFIGVSECAKAFAVSKITACRDLSELRRAEVLLQIGRGRAVRYVLKNSRSAS